MSFLILAASTAYDTVPADHLGSAGGFSHARVDREHVPARMHSPPLRLDCSDPNSAARYSKVVDTGLQEIEVEARKGVEENCKVSCGYYTLLVGDRYLIVKSSKPISETTSGELVPISGDIFNHM